MPIIQRMMPAIGITGGIRSSRMTENIMTNPIIQNITPIVNNGFLSSGFIVYVFLYVFP